MTTLTELWESYRDEPLRHCTESQLKIARKMFFAGATHALQLAKLVPPNGLLEEGSRIMTETLPPDPPVERD